MTINEKIRTRLFQAKKNKALADAELLSLVRDLLCEAHGLMMAASFTHTNMALTSHVIAAHAIAVTAAPHPKTEQP